MAARIATALVVALFLFWPSSPSAQNAKGPNLSKEQRESLRAAVMAAKAAAPLPSPESWQMHVLRASDGSHYVAFTADAPPELSPSETLALYVRLEPKPEPDGTAAVTPPRSAVEEWLAGERSDPLPMRARRVVQIPSGEMPVGGLGATSSRDGSGQNSAVLALIERQQRKEREEREQWEKARREALEGRPTEASDLLPFEDFDLAAHTVARAGRTAAIRRAVTAGPGSYDVVVAWTVLDRRNRPTKSGAFRQRITLPAIRTGQFALSSVIVADAIRERTQVFGADQQTAHPYAIGPTEIDPAGDHTFTNDERLALAFQLLNPMASPTGKPDVGVAFRLFRQTATGEEPSVGLAPLHYTEDTLPPDFDLNLGHPLLAAFTAPLRTLPRGDYRLAIGATDRLGRTSATGEIKFRVVATAVTLLAGAPRFTTPFSRARWLQPEVLDPTLGLLAEHATTPALQRLMAAARERRFVDLAADPSVEPPERGLALLLQAVAAYALGDTPRGVTVRLDRALEAGAPAAAAQFWRGAALALENRDTDAIDAWQRARAGGWPSSLTATPTADALVRLGQLDKAGAFARSARDGGVSDTALIHIEAAAELTAGRYAQAAAVLEPLVAQMPADETATWLLLHARFADMAGGGVAAASPAARESFVSLATRYIDAGGRNSGIASEWRAFVTSSSPAAP